MVKPTIYIPKGYVRSTRDVVRDMLRSSRLSGLSLPTAYRTPQAGAAEVDSGFRYRRYGSAPRARTRTRIEGGPCYSAVSNSVSHAAHQFRGVEMSGLAYLWYWGVPITRYIRTQRFFL